MTRSVAMPLNCSASRCPTGQEAVVLRHAPEEHHGAEGGPGRGGGARAAEDGVGPMERARGASWIVGPFAELVAILGGSSLLSMEYRRVLKRLRFVLTSLASFSHKAGAIWIRLCGDFRRASHFQALQIPKTS